MRRSMGRFSIRKISTSPSKLLNESGRSSLFRSSFCVCALCSCPAGKSPVLNFYASEAKTLRSRLQRIFCLARRHLFRTKFSTGKPARHPARPVTRQTQERPGKPARAERIEPMAAFGEPRSDVPISQKQKNGLDETPTASGRECTATEKGGFPLTFMLTQSELRLGGSCRQFKALGAAELTHRRVGRRVSSKNRDRAEKDGFDMLFERYDTLYPVPGSRESGALRS